MKRVLLLLALLPLSGPGLADLYKWTDANGHVQFSDQKPGHDSKAEKITPPSTPSPSGSAGTGSAGKSGPGDSIPERQKKISDVLKTEREQGEAEAARLAAQKAEKKRRCMALADYRKNIEGARLYDLDDKGERKFMTDNEREKRLSALDREIKEACQP